MIGRYRDMIKLRHHKMMQKTWPLRDPIHLVFSLGSSEGQQQPAAVT